MTTGREAKNLLSPVTGKHEAHDYPHDAVNRIRVSIEKVHAREGDDVDLFCQANRM